MVPFGRLSYGGGAQPRATMFGRDEIAVDLFDAGIGVAVRVVHRDEQVRRGPERYRMRTLSRLSPCVCWVMASVAFSSRLPTMEHNSALLMLMYCGTAALTSTSAPKCRTQSQ